MEQCGKTGSFENSLTSGADAERCRRGGESWDGGFDELISVVGQSAVSGGSDVMAAK